MHTNLIDSDNNKKVKVVNESVNINNLIESIEYRISKHRGFILLDEERIKTYSDCPEMLIDIVNNMLERKAKILELEELIEFTIL